jgi:CheY-like chemotaxis protein
MIANRTAVLYIDDKPKSSRLLATLIRICGCQVVTAAHPVQTPRHSRRLCFDLVLLDYHPVLLGSELAQKIDDILAAMRTLTCSRAVVRNKAIAGDWSDST